MIGCTLHAIGVLVCGLVMENQPPSIMDRMAPNEPALQIYTLDWHPVDIPVMQFVEVQETPMAQARLPPKEDPPVLNSKKQKQPEQETPPVKVASAPAEQPKIKAQRTRVIRNGRETVYASAYVPPATGQERGGRGFFSKLFSVGRADAKPTNWSKVDMRKPGYKHVEAAAKRYGVPVRFALGVAAQESRGNCKATSHAGARGIMQVMPGTARKHGYTKNQMYDCRTGAIAGVKELKYCLNLAKGNKAKALACYNAGPGWLTGGKNKRYIGKRLPRETRRYIKTITGKKVERVT